jgi:hypothetical protein
MPVTPADLTERHIKRSTRPSEPINGRRAQAGQLSELTNNEERVNRKALVVTQVSRCIFAKCINLHLSSGVRRTLGPQKLV